MKKYRKVLRFLREMTEKEYCWHMDIYTHKFRYFEDFMQFLELIGEREFMVRIVDLDRENSKPFLVFVYYWKNREIVHYPLKTDRNLLEVL